MFLLAGISTEGTVSTINESLNICIVSCVLSLHASTASCIVLYSYPVETTFAIGNKSNIAVSTVASSFMVLIISYPSA